MRVQRPDFSRPKLGRKGYNSDEVDRFVGLILARLEGRPEGAGVTAADVGVMVFHEERGADAYAVDEVDGWLQRVRPKVRDAEAQVRTTDAGAPDRPGSVVDMPAPPHFADRFPRVSRAVLGYAIEDVDAAMETLRAQLSGSRAPSAAQIRRLTFREQQGGYRQAAVDQAVELVAMARAAADSDAAGDLGVRRD